MNMIDQTNRKGDPIFSFSMSIPFIILQVKYPITQLPSDELFLQDEETIISIT